MSTSSEEATSAPAKRRDWGTYAFLSSVLLVVSAVLAFGLLLFGGAGSIFTVIASLFFYLAVGFVLSTVFFFILSMVTGKNRKLGIISLLGPILLIIGVVVVASVFAS